jgi:hypothetical protein
MPALRNRRKIRLFKRPGFLLRRNRQKLGLGQNFPHPP